eukprot:jgi/Picsp_1/4215/NSC_01724-R1_mediator of cell motility 1
MPRTGLKRRATHSGSWYSGQGAELDKQLATWLEVVPDIQQQQQQQQQQDDDDDDGDAAAAAAASNNNSNNSGPVKAIIAPHAGYSYSGSVMAYAYKHLNPDGIKRIFLLGPSHHFYTRHCHLSPCSSYSTPLGDAGIDEAIYGELQETGMFPYMTQDQDEDEHSLELHLPYIMNLMKGREFGLVPIVVGALREQEEAMYGKMLARYLKDPGNVFIVSSDFCHWGARFGFQFARKEDEEIHQSIAWLDSLGMKVIEDKEPEGFSLYLAKYGNTICGRHPIGVLLNALKEYSCCCAANGNKVSYTIRFTKYDRSNLVRSPSESSVSYASAIVCLK